MLLIPIAGFAASGDEFYQRLYQRGMAHFAAGEYASAFTELRNAAFGFVEQVDQFETAQAYAAIAAHRLGHDNDARDSLLRIVGAEKVQPHYRSVKLPDDLRAESDRIAAALLTSQECMLLGVPTQVQDAAKTAKPSVAVPTPGKRPNVAETAPRDPGAADTAPPKSAPGTPRKQTTPPPVAQAPQPGTSQPVAPPPQPTTPAHPETEIVPLPLPAPKQTTPAITSPANGEEFLRLSSTEKLFWSIGYSQGYLEALNRIDIAVGPNSSCASMDVRTERQTWTAGKMPGFELVSGLDKFYADPANMLIPVGTAIRIYMLQAAGKDQATIRELIDTARALAKSSRRPKAGK